MLHVGCANAWWLMVYQWLLGKVCLVAIGSSEVVSIFGIVSFILTVTCGITLIDDALLVDVQWFTSWPSISIFFDSPYKPYNNTPFLTSGVLFGS